MKPKTSAGRPALAGAILLAGLLTLAVADNARPWRRLQVEYLDLERRAVRSELAAARAGAEEGAAGERAAELRGAVDGEREKLLGRQREIEQLEGELGAFRAKLGAAERRLRALRRAREEARYRSRPEAEPQELAALDAEILETRSEIEGIREFVDDREGQLRALRSGLAAAEQQLAAHYAGVAALERRLATLERGSFFRRLPVAGLFHPSVAVRQVWPAVRPSDLPGGAGVDRCATCHLAALRPDSAGDRRPFRAHPRPDLFVGAESPHPYERFGCTSCHGGDGRATDFRRAGHPPAAEGTVPILPLPLVESACGGCHAGGWVPEAPVLSAGREAVRAMGCGGCHDFGRPLSGELPRPGPSLAGIAGKTRPAWVYRWLAAPRDFRPTTWMPHLFGPADGADPSGEQVAEILAVVSYLWERSRPAPEEVPVPGGDAEAGRALFAGVGCAGCHLLDPKAPRVAFAARLYGPNLARTGSKVAAAWLFAWLRDPRAYRADTPMPDLRLSEREAADLTAFLMTRRDAAWEGLKLPPMPGPRRDALVLAYLRREDTVEGSDARLEKMSERQRDLYLGERTIARYGCPGCHEIAGFEDAPTGEAAAGDDLRAGRRTRRIVELAAAGTFHPRPAAGGEGRPRPDYGLSPEQVRAVAVALLARGAPPPGEEILAGGRELLSRYGCRACHLVETSGPGSSLAPPLTMEGSRVRAGWLFDYLRDPAGHPIRPWLAVRMPTYHLEDAELDVLVRYFAERDGRSLLVSDPPPPRDQDLAVGRAVYAMLQCDRCHPGNEETGGLEVPVFAPSYAGARHRLRPRWVVDWILDPERWAPQTAMPASFQDAGDGRPDSSFLAGIIATPMFRREHERLLDLFADEDELSAYLSDPRRVAEALRDHLWSLEK